MEGKGTDTAGGVERPRRANDIGRGIRAGVLEKDGKFRRGGAIASAVALPTATSLDLSRVMFSATLLKLPLKLVLIVSVPVPSALSVAAPPVTGEDC